METRIEEFYQEYTNGLISLKYCIKIKERIGFIFKRDSWGLLSEWNSVTSSGYITTKTWNSKEAANEYINKILINKTIKQINLIHK